MPLAGVVVTSDPANKFNNVGLVSAIGNLRNANWWRQRSPSVRLSRTLADYQEHLRLVLRCANSIMFIDPHLDPTQPRYSHFVNLLLAMQGRSPRPLIEIHRVCYVGSGPNRQIIPQAELEQWFEQKLIDPLRDAGLEAQIFVWDDFHDRYLISCYIPHYLAQDRPFRLRLFDFDWIPRLPRPFKYKNIQPAYPAR